MKDLSTVTHTRGGFETKDIKYNSTLGYYLGFVKDPVWSTDKFPFVTCTWKSNGRCINETRPELDLVL